MLSPWSHSWLCSRWNLDRRCCRATAGWCGSVCCGVCKHCDNSNEWGSAVVSVWLKQTIPNKPHSNIEIQAAWVKHTPAWGQHFLNPAKDQIWPWIVPFSHQKKNKKLPFVPWRSQMMFLEPARSTPFPCAPMSTCRIWFLVTFSRNYVSFNELSERVL